MSTAAPSKSQQQNQSSPAIYEISRPNGLCSLCNKPIDPSTKYIAALCETPTGFQRTDYCVNCWNPGNPGNPGCTSGASSSIIAHWQSLMPRPEQKKKIFVDDTVLCELFERLASVTESPKLSFRFVLGLILMRKRLVLYESTRTEGDGDNQKEVWIVRMKGRDDTLELLNPKLDESQIHEVSHQLTEILHQEL
jgi:hypothetical protein